MKMLAAALAVFIVGGGIAYAAIPDGGKTYHACMLKGLGTIRMIDSEKQQRCSLLESEITWNERGQQGAPGAPGTNGASPAVAQLAAGDPHCAAGGAAIRDATGSTAYVCNGQAGADGRDGAGFSGGFTSPNGKYALNVTDQGVSISGGGMSASFTEDGVSIQSPKTLGLTVGTGMTMAVGNDVSLAVGGDTSLSVGRNLSVQAGNSIDLEGTTDVTVRGGHDLLLTAARNFAASAGGTGLLQSAGALTLRGSTISEN